MKWIRRAGQRANRDWAIVFALFGFVLLSACEAPPAAPSAIRYTLQPPPERLPIYRLAVHPLHNPARLSEAYQPLVDYLNQRIPTARFELEPSRNYAAFETKYRMRDPDLILPNPLQSLQAMRSGYTVIATAGDAEDFRGLFLVRRDSPIKLPTDLRGQTLACPSKTALAGCLMPLWFLHQSGLDLTREVRLREVGSHSSAILNVSLGEVAAGLTWPVPWRAFQRSEPAQAAKLKVLWETRPLINNSVMVRQDFPVDLQQQVRHSLLTMQASAAGQAALMKIDISRFYPANDASYVPARQFLSQLEHDVPGLLRAED